MYERKLIDYLPNVLKEIEEYKAILNDVEITLLWNKIDNALSDQFIDSMGENGVKRWEKILNIIPKGTLTLDERKFTIMTRLNEELPFTYTVLNERLLNLCGENNYIIDLQHNKFYIKILIALKAKNNYDDVVSMLNRIIPANMKVECIIKYNQHINLAKYTHKHLSDYTIYQLRNYEGFNVN